MSQNVAVPDDLYAKLAAYAERHGQTPERVLLDAVTETLQQDQQRSSTARDDDEADTDPIAPFIGAFTFGVGDLAEHHDKYLAGSDAGTFHQGE